MYSRKLSFLLLIVLFFVTLSCKEKKTTVVKVSEPMRVLSVRSLAPLAEFGTNDYSPEQLLDDNLTTCWSVNLKKARSAGMYDGYELQGLVFTLDQADPEVMVMWNGYCKTYSLCQQNAAAASVTVMDYATKQILGKAVVPDQFKPFALPLEGLLKACDDGYYRIQVNFNGIRPGTKYDDFCVSEIKFWSGPDYSVIYPVGDRAAFQVKGPVRAVIGKSETAEFSIDGLAFIPTGGRYSYSSSKRTTTVRQKSGDDEELVCTYDARGYLISEQEYLSIEYKEFTETTYEYNTEGNLIRLEISGLGSDCYSIYQYENGELCSLKTWDYSNSEGYGDEPSREYYYTVLETDAYGNWLKRNVYYEADKRELDEVEERQIFYF